MLNRLPMRFSSPPFLATLTALAVSLLVFALGAPDANAQVTSTGPSVSGLNGTVIRVESDGSALQSIHNHPDGVLVNAINFADCEADLKLRFQLAISGIDSSISSYNLQAWVGGVDCTAIANRTPATAQCWRVSAGDSITKVNPAQVDIRVQDILSQQGLTSTSTTYVPGTEAACHTQTTTGASALTIYFFFVTGQNEAVGTAQPYPVSADTVGGAVAGNISLSVGSTILFVNLPTETVEPDVKLWNVYCDPPPRQ